MSERPDLEWLAKWQYDRPPDEEARCARWALDQEAEIRRLNQVCHEHFHAALRAHERVRELEREKQQAVEAADSLRGAVALLKADIPCSNGCGCEDYDYCAHDEADRV